MTERPIIFSAPMVRAILDGTKTQTRRIVKPHKNLGDPAKWCPVAKAQDDLPAGINVAEDYRIFCPYGQVGERLWVRETFIQGFPYDPVTDRVVQCDADGNDLPKKTWYRATDNGISWDGEDGWETNVPWKPSIHMPRAASRITLEITGVRVERLQDISEMDALAEGAPPSHPSIDKISRSFGYPDFSRSWFSQLWESINGTGSWELNPWVWVIEFRRVKP